MKILIIRFSSIGDIILTTPIVRCLKLQLAAAEVHFLTKTAFKDIVAPNPNIDRVHLLASDLDAVIASLKAEHFDVIIDLHKNLRSARIVRALNVRTYRFDKLNVEKWLYVRLRVNLLPVKSIVDRYFDGVARLGIRDDGAGLDYFIPEDIMLSDDDIPTSHMAGYVACVIGGSYATKRLPVDRWRALIGILRFPVILLGGDSDRASGNDIASMAPVKIYNACGKFSLHESALLVRRARVVVTNDTGLMHVAAAFQKPIVSLWGNTAPEFGMFPYYGASGHLKEGSPKSTIVERRLLYCRPCSKLGYQRCPLGHFKCMNDLDLGDVKLAVEKYWSLTQR